MGISKKIQDVLFDAEHRAVDLQGRLEHWKEQLLAKAHAMEIEEQAQLEQMQLEQTQLENNEQ